MSNFNAPFSKLYFNLPLEHLKQTGEIIKQNLVYYQIPYLQYLQSINKLYEDYYQSDDFNLELENYESIKIENQKKKLSKYFLTDLINTILEDCEVFIGENIDLIVENIIDAHRDH